MFSRCSNGPDDDDSFSSQPNDFDSSNEYETLNESNDTKASRDLPGTENGVTGPKQCAGTAASGEVLVCDDNAKKAATVMDGEEFSMDLDEKSILT